MIILGVILSSSQFSPDQEQLNLLLFLSLSAALQRGTYGMFLVCIVLQFFSGFHLMVVRV